MPLFPWNSKRRIRGGTHRGGDSLLPPWDIDKGVCTADESQATCHGEPVFMHSRSLTPVSGLGQLHRRLRSFLPLLVAANPPWDFSQPSWGVPCLTSQLSGSPSHPQGPAPGQTQTSSPLGPQNPCPLWPLQRGEGGDTEGRLTPGCLHGLSHQRLLFRPSTPQWEP